MTKRQDQVIEAYKNLDFLVSREGRALRILAEYMEPKSRFEHYLVEDTVVFMGSARTPSMETAQARMMAAEKGQGSIDEARRDLEMAAYYEAARDLARRLTEWSKRLDETERRFVVCTGGGPGIMEAANRGASEAQGINVGLGIQLPEEQFDNPYITRELSFHFHYFFMRKFWFAYLAKAVIIFPGGFGTLDELFEILTLVQTRKIRKRLPIVLFGTKYWDAVFNLETLVRYGTINAEDLELMHRTDSVDDAYEFLTRQLVEYAMSRPGATL